VAAALELASLCWGALKDSLVQRFAEAGQVYRRNTCPLLTQRKAL